jgi:hypothetical protein
MKDNTAMDLKETVEENVKCIDSAHVRAKRPPL